MYLYEATQLLLLTAIHPAYSSANKQFIQQFKGHYKLLCIFSSFAPSQKAHLFSAI
jgi:hypothetical protein